VVNHARNLLMNVTGSSGLLLEYLAEEFIDPDYHSLTLPSALLTIRNVLFGAQPDRHMLNIRCRQLLGLTHSTPLADYLTKLDKRITYSTEFTTLFTQVRPEVVTLSGDGTLAVYGESTAPDASGIVYNGFLLTVTGTGEVTVERTVYPFQKVVFEFEAGQRLALPSSSLTFKLSSTEAGQTYCLYEYTKPQKDLAQLAADLTNLGEPVYNYLFGVKLVEPFKTFKALWTRKQELPLKLGAFVCALVYRTEIFRQTGA